jgi:putative ABC transport system ATP-binding protein
MTSPQDAPATAATATEPNRPLLRFDGVSFGYPHRGKMRHILRQVDLDLHVGRMYSIIGPSGSGKTTLLSLAAGLSSPQSGRVWYDGQEVARIGL